MSATNQFAQIGINFRSSGQQYRFSVLGGYLNSHNGSYLMFSGCFKKIGETIEAIGVSDGQMGHTVPARCCDQCF
jgi:hypothetical protein